MGQLFPHATIQDAKKPSEKEMVLNVEMPATIHDIESDTIRLNKIGAKPEGSFILSVGFPLTWKIVHGLPVDVKTLSDRI